MKETKIAKYFFIFLMSFLEGLIFQKLFFLSHLVEKAATLAADGYKNGKFEQLTVILGATLSIVKKKLVWSFVW